MPGRKAALLVALTVVAVGCEGDGEPLEPVRALQLGPAAPPRAGPARLNASLTPASVAAASPPVHVPHVGSVAAGRPNGGRLVNGVQLPAWGRYWVTWDPILHRVPNRGERRWGTDRLLGFLAAVLRDYHLANPSAPPVLVGDLSRPQGGAFGSNYGGLGHASHQNGLDADIYYPRADGALLAAERPAEVDHTLAQDLVDRFVAAGAEFAFVGEHVGLGGPSAIVQAIPHHDDHVHVRIAGGGR